MSHRFSQTRRGFGHGLVGFGSLALALGIQRVRAAAPDGAGSVLNMVAVLQSAKSLSFTVGSSFGTSVAKENLKTLGSRASVVFQRPDTLFVVFGEGGEDDIQLLVTGGQATLFRTSLASKTVLKIAPESGAAFSVPGLFIPFLGLLSDSAETDLFGEIKSLTPIAQGTANQAEPTTLVEVLGSSFTGEVWTSVSSGLPSRVSGTWFSSKGDAAASAAVSFADWSFEPPAEGAFPASSQLEQAKSVNIEELGL